LELLRSTGDAYILFLCQLIAREIQRRLSEHDVEVETDFEDRPTITTVQRALSSLSTRLAKRIVLFFDDAAHIGREASLSEFFDLFRTISSSTVSCKAAIYPGVTRFGTRFDVYNDATVLEVSRSEELPGFAEFFADVMQARFPHDFAGTSFASNLTSQKVAAFLGQAVLGNVRAFLFACNDLLQRSGDESIGLTGLSETLITLSSNHYWPLLEELKPKLGAYEAMLDAARTVAEHLFAKCAVHDARPLALVHRDITEQLSKPFEMLEYVGFVAKREASRAMKSGGRGARYSLNLCTLLEKVPGTRLTSELYTSWTHSRSEPVEFHRGSELASIPLPMERQAADLEILQKPIETLAKSHVYPYGLTEAKIAVLKEAGIMTVGALAEAKDDTLLSLQGVGTAFLRRFRNVIGQAVWM
jgi:hypothetical protein